MSIRADSRNGKLEPTDREVEGALCGIQTACEPASAFVAPPGLGRGHSANQYFLKKRKHLLVVFEWHSRTLEGREVRSREGWPAWSNMGENGLESATYFRSGLHTVLLAASSIYPDVTRLINNRFGYS